MANEEMNMDDRETMNFEERSEFSKQNNLMRVIIGLLSACIGTAVLGLVTIYVNDGKQDEDIRAHEARFLLTPTREEVQLLDKLVLAEIKSTKATNKNMQKSLDRVVTALLSMSEAMSDIKVKLNEVDAKK